jgi:hypothetical protein
MSFKTRPVFSDRQIRQGSGDNINLFGDTNFQGKLRSKGVEIDGDISNASPGYVLTYDGGKIRLLESSGGEGGGGGTSGIVIEIEYNLLKTLKDNSQLEIGVWYKIVDYQTIHRIQNTTQIHYGPIEPLYIYSIDTDKLTTRVYSDIHPNDIIEFDFNDDVCEDLVTPRKGRILFRHDLIKDISTYYDWREFKFRRWKVISKIYTEITKINDTLFEGVMVTGVFGAVNDVSMASGAANFLIKFETGITHDAGDINLNLTRTSPLANYTKPLIKWNGLPWAANELAGTEGMIVHCRIRNVYVYFNARAYGNELLNKYASVIPSPIFIPGIPSIRYNVDPDDFQDYYTFNDLQWSQNVHISLPSDDVRYQDFIGPNNNNKEVPNNIVFLNETYSVNITGLGQRSTFLNFMFKVNFKGTLTSVCSAGSLNTCEFLDVFDCCFYTNVSYFFIENFLSTSSFYLSDWSKLNSVLVSLIETISRPIITESNIRESFISVGGANTTSTFPVVPNNVQTGTTSPTNRTSFIIEGGVNRSLIGWFHSEGVTLSRSYNFESVWEVEKLQNVVDKLKIDNLVTPAVGNIKLLGRDEKGNVVDGDEQNNFVRILEISENLLNFNIPLKPQIVNYINSLSPNFIIDAKDSKINIVLIKDNTFNVECGTSSSFSGGQSYPQEDIVNLGTDGGNVTINYDAVNFPDRFIVLFENVIVIDTGYRGAESYNFEGSQRQIFINSLSGRTDPIFGTTYPDFINFIEDGYPLVVSPGNGSDTFIKTTVTQNAIVRVYGPLANTIWDYTLDCPDGTFTPTILEEDLKIVYELINIGKGEYGSTGNQINVENLLLIYSNQINEGNSLPDGGIIGQVLTKQSDTDGDANWENLPNNTLQDITDNGNITTNRIKHLDGIEPDDSATLGQINTLIDNVVDNLTSTINNRTFGINIDGSGNEITTGLKGYFTVPYDAEILEWFIVGDTTGSISIDIWKSNVVPTALDSICNGNRPSLNNQQLNSDDILSGWDLSLNKGNIMAFNVVSVSTVTFINLTIKIKLT